MNLIFLLYIFALNSSHLNFESLRREVYNLSELDNYMLIVINGASCSSCLKELNEIISDIPKIDSFVAIKSKDDVILRKSLINFYKKFISPTKWLFYKDNKIIEENDFKNSPNVIIKKNKKYYVFTYNELFSRSEENSKLTELINLLKE